MSATAIQSQPAQLHELGRYSLSDQERVLVGRRIDGEVFVYDYPRDGHGRGFFVESGFESKAELAVMLADYRRQAARVGACPMSGEAIERGFQLAARRVPEVGVLQTARAGLRGRGARWAEAAFAEEGEEEDGDATDDENKAG